MQPDNNTVHVINRLQKVLYGPTLKNAIDATPQIKKFIQRNTIIDTHHNINSIIGIPPDTRVPKKLYIFTDDLNSYPNITIDECGDFLSEKLIFLNTDPLTIHKALYGPSVEQSEDVSQPIHDYISKNGQLTVTDNILPSTKQLYIYFNETHHITLSGNLIATPHHISHITNPILFYIICHDDNSYNRIAKYQSYSYVKIIRIETTKYLESNIFFYLDANRTEWTHKKYIGFLTYSFEQKTKPLDVIYKDVSQAATNTDKLFTFRAGRNLAHDLHGSIRQIFDYTLPKMEIKSINYSNVPAFYSNYWMTSPTLMSKYVNFALKYISILENKQDTHLQNLLNKNANYLKKPTPQIIKAMGFPYYTNHCFVLERLPAIFFWINGIPQHIKYFYP
ncbi:MAG: hypothetical protein Hyperionvirus26_31 [Hyperionvirus sp.]|uniref:Uncharacterized protein n=1 Tax=Hyperionvirus sp. TaxID=2487770 RepID=A0A3G5AB69_9VIRU|nr:MAG: hypothetical protein Hyperionvirus26_31 [Hyperionvirus sp.]